MKYPEDYINKIICGDCLTELHEKAWDLEKGADALRDLREAEMYEGKIAETKAWAKKWFGVK